MNSTTVLPTKVVASVFLILGGFLGAHCFGESGSVPEFTGPQLEHFEKEIRPLLVEHCYECHSARATKRKAGLRVDSRHGLLKGGDSGPSIEPGSADDSLLIQAVRYESFEMPPKGPLSARQIEALTRWVNDGAPMPTEDESTEAIDPETFDWQQRKAEHWSWHPIEPVTPPSPASLSDAEFAKGPIDAFVLQKLDQKGLIPAPPADSRTLLRRVYFDLIGLPPTPEQQEAFLADDRPDAYDRVVDELLASPHFGEKWARHWLDLVRYAESYGHEFDYSIPQAWRYRDYVIDAFNEDIGYDQFLREHFAGDLLQPPRRDKKGLNRSIVATGFWFLGEATHAPTDVAEDQASRIENQIDVACRSFMGLSVSCARCHDHKFDPISTADYYAFSGVMQSSRRHLAQLYPEGTVQKAVRRVRKAENRLNEQFDQALQQSMDGQQLAAILMAAFGDRMQPTEDTSPSDAQTKGEGDRIPSKIPEQTLQKWIQAIEDKACQSIEHPFWIWNQIARCEPGSIDPAHMAGWMHQIEAAQRRSVEALDDWQVVPSVGSSPDATWYATGAAFETSRTGSLRIPVAAPSDDSRVRVVTHPGHVAGRLNRDLTGVLRSPSFRLNERGEARLRVRGSKARITLTIHGYYMAPFNGLLFNRTFVQPKDLGDPEVFRWVTLGNALQKNCEAHIEVQVEKGGWAEVGEIRIARSDSQRLDPVPDSALVELARNPAIRSIQTLADFYADRWDTCRQRFSVVRKSDQGKPFPKGLDRSEQAGATERSSSDARWLDWLLARRLLRLPDALQQSINKSLETIANATGALPAPVSVLAITEGTPMDGQIAIRGKVANAGDRVPRRLPVAMFAEEQTPVRGSGRLELANRLLRDDNPLTARVEVNRLWHHLFGRGIVPTVCDFGAMGQPPSHPELLDWLADALRTRGWSRKAMIREMVLSHTYRMSSQPKDQGLATERDPENRWLHRMSVRRLTAEAIRDQLLHVAGDLKPEVGGPSVPVFLTPFMDGRGKPQGGPRNSNGRRSIYIAIRRNFLPTDLLAFDFPKPLSAIGDRTRSNVPAQSLFMMNNPLVREQAEHLAKRLVAMDAQSDARLTLLFETVIGRPPTPSQVEQCKAFLKQLANEDGGSPDGVGPWTELCHTLFNTKDFIFLR